MLRGVGDPPFFPPAIALYLVKLACELPDVTGRCLSLWTCAELARSLKSGGFVDAISPQSVQRILKTHQLKPWRVHHWLSPKVPRDAAFRETVLELCELYTRPAQPGLPVRIEHEYERKGAVNIFAAFDTRLGEVSGICRRRKRQDEFIELLEEIDHKSSASITRIHLICDNASRLPTSPTSPNLNKRSWPSSQSGTRSRTHSTGRKRHSRKYSPRSRLLTRPHERSEIIPFVVLCCSFCIRPRQSGL